MAHFISPIFHFGKSLVAYLRVNKICFKRSTLIYFVLHFLLAVEKYDMHGDREIASK